MMRMSSRARGHPGDDGGGSASALSRRFGWEIWCDSEGCCDWRLDGSRVLNWCSLAQLSLCWRREGAFSHLTKRKQVPMESGAKSDWQCRNKFIAAL